MHSHESMHTKLELGLESILQITIQLLLLFYANTETKATRESAGLLLDSKIEFLFLFSFIWSLVSCIRSHIAALSARRTRFPFASQVVVALYALMSITTRLLVIIIYFTPSLGLFNVLRHWQGEQFNWHPAKIENLVVDKTVTFEGASPIEVNSIFNRTYPSLYRSFNETFIKNVAAASEKFTISGKFQFGDSSPIAWDQLDRCTYHLDNTSPTLPDYTLYTLATLKVSFFIFIAIHLIQTFSIFILKSKMAKAFSNFNVLEKIIHCLESTNLPYNVQEWDTPREGNAEDHVKWMKANRLEGLALIGLNFIFKLVMLIPIFALGNKF